MKKSLLTESEIRKFMKFANIETLSENFINNTTLEEEVVEEATEELEEGYHDAPRGRDHDERMEEGAHDRGKEAAHDKEETLEEEIEDPTEFVQDLVDVIMNHLDAKITVVRDEEGAEADPMDPMDDMDDEEDAPEMPGDEMPGDEMAMSGEMAPEDDEEPPMMEDLVNEVTKRVASRLLKESKR